MEKNTAPLTVTTALSDGHLERIEYWGSQWAVWDENADGQVERGFFRVRKPLRYGSTVSGASVAPWGVAKTVSILSARARSPFQTPLGNMMALKLRLTRAGEGGTYRGLDNRVLLRS